MWGTPGEGGHVKSPREVSGATAPGVAHQGRRRGVPKCVTQSSLLLRPLPPLGPSRESRRLHLQRGSQRVLWPALEGVDVQGSPPSTRGRRRIVWSRGRGCTCGMAVRMLWCADPTGRYCTKGAHRALCLRCAKSRLFFFGPVFPDGQGDRGHYCVPRHRTTRILTQSKNSDDELKQTMFPTNNARVLSKSAVLALWT